MEDTKKEQLEESKKKLAKIIYENREKILADNARFEAYIPEEVKRKENNDESKLGAIDEIFEETKIKDISDSKLKSFFVNSVNTVVGWHEKKRDFLVTSRNNYKKSLEAALKHTNRNKVKSVLYNEGALSLANKRLDKYIKTAQKKGMDIHKRDINRLRQFLRGQAQNEILGEVNRKQIGKYKNAIEMAQKDSRTSPYIKKLFQANKKVDFLKNKIVNTKAIKWFSKNDTMLKYGKGFAKGLGKAFSIAGMGMNLYTIHDKNQPIFKKGLAILDLAGDAAAIALAATPLAPVGAAASLVTGAVNFGGSLLYDAYDNRDKIKKGLGVAKDKVLNSIKAKIKTIKKNPIKETLKTSMAITNPLGYTLFKTGSKVTEKLKPKIANGLKTAKNKVLSIIKTKVNAIKENPIKESLKTSMAIANPLGYIGANMVSKAIKAFKPKNTKGQALKRPSNVISLYNNKANSVKTNNSKINYDKAAVGTKLLGNKNYSSKKNDFTININGSGLSVDQVANELASKIQLTMANI